MATPVTTDPRDAATEIGRLATRIVKLAPIAGLHVGITIKPAPRKKAPQPPAG